MNENINLSYLNSLKGRVVRVFKGGPESKNGRLSEVHSDFLSLETENEGIIYYQTCHLKSVIEDSRFIAFENNVIDLNNQVQATNFLELLNKLENRLVRIDRGGPESRVGRLLSTESDHLVLKTNEDGLVYYQLQHIKSISVEDEQKNITEASTLKTVTAEATIPETDTTPEKESNPVDINPEYFKVSNFNELLNQLIHRWVIINRGGPESIEGVLVSNTDDYLILICKEQVHRLTKFHVRNISHQYKDKNNNNNNGSSSENKNEEKGQEKKGKENKETDNKEKEAKSEENKPNNKEKEVNDKGKDTDNKEKGKNKDQDKGKDKDKGKEQEKGKDKDKGKEQEKGKDKDKGKEQDKGKDKDKAKDQEKGKDKDKGKEQDKGKDKDKGKEQDKGKDKDKGKGQDKGKDKDKGKGQDKGKDKDKGKDQDKGKDKDKDKGKAQDKGKEKEKGKK